MKKFLGILLFTLFFSACGNAQFTFDSTVITQMDPIITSISPDSGPPGTTVDVFGMGFSVTAGNNIFSFGSYASPAGSYNFVGVNSEKLEQLTLQIPSNATPGSYPVLVNVFDNASNIINFTVTK